MSATVDETRDGPVVAERPAPGAPRSYEFPPVTRRQLPNGLQILIVDLPGTSARVGVDRRRGRRGRGAGRSGRSDRAGRPGPDRGHRALRGHRPRRGVRAAGRLAPRRIGLGHPERQRRRPVGPPGGRPRPGRRGPPSSDLSRAGGRTPARRTAQRPAPGPGRSAPARGGGLRRDDLCLELALSPAIGRDARDRRGPGVRPAPRGLPAHAPSGASHPDRRRRPRGPGCRRHGRAPVRGVGRLRCDRGRIRDRSPTRARRSAASSGSSIGRARCRPRSASAIEASRAGSRTSMRSR